MDGTLEHSAEEVKHLQRCINDLVSVLALPAMWSGGEPSRIVSTLLDTVLGMLRLEFVYVRLKDTVGEAPIEMVRVAQSRKLMPRSQEICEVLNQWFGDDPRKWPQLIRNPVGDGDISIVPLRLGLQGEIGVIVAGSKRADFPGQTERLILSVAANQASIGLQEARLLSEQKRVATELDQRVAQRTAELAATNEELKKEVAERRLVEGKLRREETELKRSIASQAAILLENTRLYGDLAERESKIRRLVDANIIGIFIWEIEGRILEANDAFLRMIGYDRDDLVSGRLRWTDLTPPEWLERDTQQLVPEMKRTGSLQPFEKEYFRKDGSRVPVLIGVATFDEASSQGAAFVLDLTERKRAEEALRRSEKELQDIFDTIPAMAFSTAADGSQSRLNRRWCEYTGILPQWAGGVEVDNPNWREVTIIVKLLAKNAEDRYQTAAGVEADLRSVSRNGNQKCYRKSKEILIGGIHHEQGNSSHSLCRLTS